MKLAVAAANDNHKPAKLLRYCDLKEKHGITFSRRHLRRLEDTGKFPRRIHIGPKTPAWNRRWFVRKNVLRCVAMCGSYTHIKYTGDRQNVAG